MRQSITFVGIAPPHDLIDMQYDIVMMRKLAVCADVDGENTGQLLDAVNDLHALMFKAFASDRSMPHKKAQHTQRETLW
jgi:hypothetical protein